MPGFVRSFLIALAVTLAVALPVSGWYWASFRQPAQTELSALKESMSEVTRLLHEQEDLQAVALLDQLPYRVVVADAGQQAQTSNLATQLKRRRDAGQLALESGRFERFLLSRDGAFRYYYQLPSSWWDPHLIAPLLFGLLLGLLAVIWDLFYRRQLEDQADALIILRQEMNDNDDHELLDGLRQEKEKLLEQIKNLDQARVVEPNLDLMELRKRNQALSLELETLRDELKKQEQKKQRFQHEAFQAQLEEKMANVKAELHALQLEQKQEQAEFQQFQSQKEQEITELHQDKVRLERDLEKVNDRLQDQSDQHTKLHEAWLEIEDLRKQQTQLLQREEQWHNEKKRLMGLMHEKDEKSNKAEERLKEARKKIHELSVAYKQQLETIQNLPDSMKEVHAVLAMVIDEKDQIEHENAELRLDMAEKESEMHRMQTELGVRHARLEESKRLIEELSDNLRSNERELGLLSDTLDDKLHDLERLKDIHNEETQILEGVTQERDNLRLHITELESRLDHLQAEHNELLLERDELALQLEEIDVDAYELEIEQLRQSVKLMGQQQQRRVDTVETLKTKLKEGEALYNRLKRHAEQQEEEIRSLQQQLSRYRSELNLITQGDGAGVV